MFYSGWEFLKKIIYLFISLSATLLSLNVHGVDDFLQIILNPLLVIGTIIVGYRVLYFIMVPFRESTDLAFDPRHLQSR